MAMDLRFFQDDVPCTSIFVRDFPPDVTPEKLEEAFSRFGTVKGGTRGISLKNQRGKDGIAFVEFEEAAAVQAAIEGQVIINGQQVCEDCKGNRQAHRPCLHTLHQYSYWSLHTC